MGKVVTAEVDTRQFDIALRRYQQAVSQDMPAVVRAQSRLLVRDLVKAMGPDSRAKAASAIDRDVRRVFKTPKAVREEVEALIHTRTREFLSEGHEVVSKVRWRNQRLGKRIDAVFMKGDATAMEAIWRNVYRNPMNMYPVTDHIEPARMRAARNPKTGSVPKGARGQTVIFAGRDAKIKEFVRQRQADIGIAKAGWMDAAIALDAPVPAFVRKQPRRMGTVTQDLRESALAPFVEVTNHAQPAIAQDAAFHVLQKAVSGRARAMEDDMRRKLERREKEFNQQ